MLIGFISQTNTTAQVRASGRGGVLRVAASDGAAELLIKAGGSPVYAARRIQLLGATEVAIREASDQSVSIELLRWTSADTKVKWDWLEVDPHGGDGALLLPELLAAGSTDVPPGAYECEIIRAAGGGTYQWSTPWTAGASVGPTISLPTSPVRVYPAGSVLTLSAAAQVVWRLRNI